MNSFFPIQAKRGKKGFTVMEIVIAAAIASAAMIFITFLTVEASKNVTRLTNEVEGAKDASFALEFIRYHLSMGQYTTAVVSDDFHRIEFKDPNLDGPRSAFEFKDNALWYDRDVGDMDEEKKVDRLVNVVFTPLSMANIVQVDITARARDDKGLMHPFVLTGKVHLRN